MYLTTAYHFHQPSLPQMKPRKPANSCNALPKLLMVAKWPYSDQIFLSHIYILCLPLAIYC